MVFGSGIFLYGFLPLFLLLYYLTPRRGRTLVVAISSYVFYGWWRPDFVILMWISTVVDFYCGRRIERDRAREQGTRRWVLLSLLVNLGLLGYFKYANFGIDTLNVLLAQAGIDAVQWTRVVLPVGISFYTFQTISYTVDVYRGVAPPVRSFRDFMCYVAMFPQLVAGPIVRYHTIADQLHSRTHTAGKFYRGVLSLQAGLVKKLLIADVLGSLADEAFASPELSTADAWIGVLAYNFQIYFDFSGYSDMAIGLGLMIGFRLPINFDQPYRSKSITEFWRRWHVSLSSFLRDYLYLPLGGNRRGPVRTYVNLALVMLLGGIWHGAGWTFVVWGAYQGFWLIAERMAGKRSLFGWLPGFMLLPVTMVVVVVGWTLFRAETLDGAFSIIAALFGGGDVAAAGVGLDVRPIHWVAGVLAVVVVYAFPTTQALLRRAPSWWVLILQSLFLVALAQLHHASHVPFLYFQF